MALLSDSFANSPRSRANSSVAQMANTLAKTYRPEPNGVAAETLRPTSRNSADWQPRWLSPSGHRWTAWPTLSDVGVTREVSEPSDPLIRRNNQVNAR
jgi:hypothetical protein